MQEYVAGLLFNPERTKVVLVKKNRPEWQAGLLNGVGGKVEPNESLLGAMIREFREETGLEITRWRKGFKLVREEAYVVQFYTAFSEDFEKVRTMESEEIGIYDVSPLPTNLIPNLNWIIPLLLDQNVLLPGVIYDVAGN